MNTRLLAISLFAALLATGCAKNEPAATASNSAASTAATNATPTPPPATAPVPSPTVPAASQPAAPASTSAAAPAAKGEARTVEITANDQMQFNVKSIEAKAGEQLKVVLNNVGSLPKEAMGHNWVLLKAGTDVNAFATAAMTAKATDYIPPAMKDQVIAATPVIGPKQKADVTFTVPAAGEYVYICSFPGHYMIMRGVLKVQ